MDSRALASIAADASDSLGALERTRRIAVSQSAAESLVLDDAGGYTGPWDPATVPYLIEPMDMLASRHHSAVCFVGPARSGKTAGLILGWLAHAVTADIGRMLIMHMTREKSQLFSKLDVETSISASERLSAYRSPRAHDNSIGLKVFKHGMAVRFAYPSRAEMAGTTYRYVALTDYDRYREMRNMGGSIFDSASKRTQTLMSRGMVLVESSPERQVMVSKWGASTPHEAPPCEGILGIYNRSDRRRWYWPCPHCGEYFEASPGLSLFATLPEFDALKDAVKGADLRQLAADHARVACPHCGGQIEHDDKFRLNAAGRWLGDGQTIDRDGVTAGRKPSSSIAGYWLGGVAAAYQTWHSILENYLQGVSDYVKTGSETTLEAKTYVDQAMPYTPRALGRVRTSSELRSRTEDWERFTVPEGVRTLIAAVDNQKNRFEIRVWGYGVGRERWLIDVISLREWEGEPVSPATHAEHWAAVTARAINATYRLGDGKELRVWKTAVDSAGYAEDQEAQTTLRAYDWWRSIHREGFGHRVRLVKGSAQAQVPIRETYPDTSKRTDRKSGSRGDVPVLELGSNLLKDAAFADLTRDAPGPGYIHLPSWASDDTLDELVSETRGPKGWTLSPGRRNETWDSLYYADAIWRHFGGDRIDWTIPPPWAAADWPAHSEVIDSAHPVAPRPVAQARPVRFRQRGR